MFPALVAIFVLCGSFSNGHHAIVPEGAGGIGCATVGGARSKHAQSNPLPPFTEIPLVKPFELLGETTSADGTVLKLTRRDRQYTILADGKTLMSSAMYGSE